MELPRPVTEIIETLERAGYSAFAVGGCVRDLARGVLPHDFDLASGCAPEEVLALFPKSFATGLKHGTVTVLHGGEAVEVTRFRVDGAYSDARRPDSVSPADSIEADLSRRDFTVNAMAWNPARGLTDPFGGARDLQNRVIRCVGDPALRFSEDALRILRAFRFAAQLDFSIEPQTLETALRLAPSLRKISAERIFSELVRLLCSKAPSNAAELFTSGALGFLGLAARADVSALDALPNVREVRFAALCALCSREPAPVCAALKADNHLAKTAGALYEMLLRPLPASDAEMKRRFAKLPPEYWEHLLSARAALFAEDVSAARGILQKIAANAEPWKLSMLAVGGADLQRLGLRGPEIGRTLEALLRHVVQNPADNQREILLGLIKGHKAEDKSRN